MLPPAESVSVRVPAAEGARAGQSGPRVRRGATGGVRKGGRRASGVTARRPRAGAAEPDAVDQKGPVARRRLAAAGAAEDQRGGTDQPAVLRHADSERPKYRRAPISGSDLNVARRPCCWKQGRTLR